MARLSYISIFLSFFISCGEPSFDSIEGYRDWVFSDDSGFLQISKSENMTFELVYLPAEIQSDFYNDSVVSNFLVFQFKIYPNNSEDVLKFGLENKEEYKRRVSMLEYEMGDMFYAISQDSLKPSFCHYENYRGIKNEILVHVHFTLNEKLKDNFQVYFKDTLFKTGVHEFQFDSKKINNPPTLNKQAS